MRRLVLASLLVAAACTSFTGEDDPEVVPGDRDASAPDATVSPAPDAGDEPEAQPPVPSGDWYQDGFDHACSGWIVNRATMVWVDAGGRGGGGACLACFQDSDAGSVNPVADKYVPTVDGGATATYEADTWVRSVDGGKAGQARLVAFSRTADGGFRTNQSNSVEVGADWALIQVVTTPPEPVVRVDLRITGSSSCFFVDDLRVYPQP